MRLYRPNTRIQWYRTPIPKETLRKLNERSDLKGGLQTLGFLGLVLLTGASSFYAWLEGWWWLFGLFLFLHGTVTSFYINGVHELSHGTVFKTKWLNGFFVHLMGFLGIINHHMFWFSHAEHHKYTLNPPYDQEVLVPQNHSIKNFFQVALVNIWVYRDFFTLWRWSFGTFKGEWESFLVPEQAVNRRKKVAHWSRAILLGHLLIAVVSISFGYWIIPVLVSLSNAYGTWLFWLCNNTQHAGMVENRTDFRLSCRTILLNPIVQFLYWNMNWHIEHHMYAAVPCYNLRKLHHSIEYDLPHCPKGLIQTWVEIGAIQYRQRRDPEYRFLVELPNHKSEATEPCVI